MRSEIESRAALLPISLATLLVFSNNPADHPYQPERTLRPNSGKYRLQPSVRTNVPFLEHENRVWEILSLAHLLPPYPGKDALENIIFTELDRCDLEKERHWNVQRMQLDMQTIVNWLGRLLSRPGIEDILDDYPRAALAAQSQESGGWMSDIWCSPVVAALNGPDGKRFFGPERPEHEGRYLFGLAVDGFNPFHMKTAKQVVTSTGFFLVLYNFPPHLRYLTENICLVGTGP
ncbi:hypothetical protein C8F04DRAFT_974788, partial [Mycena alexandri]